MTCPKCAAALEKVSFAGIEVDRCTGCRGLWFDMLEDDKLRRVEGSEAIDSEVPMQQSSTDSELECPKCHTKMMRMTDPRQSHVTFESCSICYGLFLDAGEFRDLKEETFKELVAHYRQTLVR